MIYAVLLVIGCQPSTPQTPPGTVITLFATARWVNYNTPAGYGESSFVVERFVVANPCLPGIYYCAGSGRVPGIAGYRRRVVGEFGVLDGIQAADGRYFVRGEETEVDGGRLR